MYYSITSARGTVNTSSYLTLYKKNNQTFPCPSVSEPSHLRVVITFSRHQNMYPASTTWSSGLGYKPCLHECWCISGSEEQICHWSLWGEALQWQMGLCLWNERMMENVTQYLMRSTAFCQHKYSTHTLRVWKLTPDPSQRMVNFDCG